MCPAISNITKLIVLLTSLLLLSSCAKKILIQEAYQLETEAVATESRVDVRTYYVGDAYNYISFQVDVDNRSGDTIYLSEKDLVLKMNHEGGRPGNYKALTKNQVIEILKNERETLEVEKKSSTVNRSVVSGIGLVANILGGGNVINNIVDGSDIATSIVEERHLYNLDQKSIEEQILYVKEYTLDTATLLPGRSGSYDVHFERLMEEGVANLVISCGSEEFVTCYELVIEEQKEGQ